MHNEMTPSQQDQRVVVDQVLSTTANIHLLPEQAIDAGPFFSQQPLASMIGYTAPVNRLLILHCSQTLALQLTSSFFDRSLPSSIDVADVADTMTELINMIGGNLKALMPDETSLSIPGMLPRDESHEKVDGQLSRTWLATSAGPMCLTFAQNAFD